MKTETELLKWKSVKLPDKPRDFTTHERNILSTLTFGKKPYDKASEKARYYVGYTITLIEMNGGLQKECSLAVHELGTILGSVRTAQRVMKCLEPIIDCNNHWIRESRTAKKYQIADRFRNCNIMAKVKIPNAFYNKPEETVTYTMSEHEEIEMLLDEMGV